MESEGACCGAGGRLRWLLLLVLRLGLVGVGGSFQGAVHEREPWRQGSRGGHERVEGSSLRGPRGQDARVALRQQE